MRDELDKYKVFTRRGLILNSIKLLLFSTILGRYFYLQVIKSDKYSALSDKNRLKFMIIPAERGKIFDRANQEITSTTRKFRLILSPYEIKNLSTIRPIVEKVLDRPLNFTDEELKRKLLKRSKNEPLILEENIAWKDLVKVNEQIEILPGIDVAESSVRVYLQGEATSHVTGYISTPTEEELEKLELPFFNDLKIGKCGLELSFDSHLRGEPGARKAEVNVHGRFVREIAKKEATPGQNLQTTIDLGLQTFIHQLFKQKNINGSAVVMNVKTGEVLALYSSPTFDPNQFIDGVSKDYWNALNADPQHPLTNNAISVMYPPGSTFKPITALAGLAHGIDPHKKFFCSGEFVVGDRTFRCWKPGGHGNIDLVQAISQSCNPYFYNIGQTIGIESIAAMARKMGYGTKTNIELPFELNGLIPDIEWKKKVKKSAWFKGDTINVSIGQGDVLITPMQLAMLVSRIATGKQIFPKLIMDKTIDYPELDLNPEHLALVRKGMEFAVNDPLGAASRHSLKDQKINFAGKTGTAQVAALKFKNKNASLRHHALFMSFAPVEDPEYSVAVVVKHGEAGAKAAAPIAKQIYLKLFHKKTELDIDLDDDDIEEDVVE